MSYSIHDQRDYWKTRAEQSSHQATEHIEEARRLRGVTWQAKAELVAITQAVNELLEAIGLPADPKVADACSALRTALQGKLTTHLGDAVNIYSVCPVLREMFARMKTRDKLARAAEGWVIEKLKRRRISFKS